MGQSGDHGIPPTILHYDEHLVFPGYDVMVGKGCVGRNEKDGREPWAVGNPEVEADSAGHGRSSTKTRLYKGRRKHLVVPAIIWWAASSSIPSLPFANIPFYRVS